jgi:hypothetical protein
MFLAEESVASDMLVGVLFGLVQDLHCDGEGGQTHRMGNNTSLLELPTEFGTQQLGKPMLQDQRKIWLVNILLPYDCMQVQAS